MDGISEEKLKWFKEQNFEVQLYPEKTVKKFPDPQDLWDFLEQEKACWSGFTPIQESFNAANSGLKNAIHTDDSQVDMWQRHFKSAVDGLRRAESNCKSGQYYMLFSTTRVGKKVKAIFDEHGRVSAEYFLHFFFRTGGRVDQKDQLVGAIEGYLFSEQGKHLRKTVSKNTQAFDELHSSLDTFFDDCVKSATERHKDFDSIKAEIAAWKSEEEAAVNTQRAEFQTSHDGLGQQHNEEFVQSMKDWKQEIADLKELYAEKLKLEEPIKYWEELQEKHSRMGWLLSGATAIISLGLVFAFISILYEWPPQWLEGNRWDLNTVKGTILLLTMTSIGIFMIHLGAKFAVSSFHLSRDAQERRQLTYIYLALIKQGAIKPEEQQIVLQALFSRADTGLLKGDHGPTMPLADFVSNLNK